MSTVNELGVAISHTAAAVGAGGAGMVCVTGSLNTVSRAQACAVERGADGERIVLLYGDD